MKAGLEDTKAALLVLIGGLSDGTKVVLAVESGHRESDAEKQRRAFRNTFGGTYQKAVEILEKDWPMLTAYFAFPKEHWKHLRTTNVIESPFSAVRLRTSAAKRFKRVDNATAMIWKLTLVAEQSFRKLNAPELCHAVYNGTQFCDGMKLNVNDNLERVAAFYLFPHLLKRPPDRALLVQDCTATFAARSCRAPKKMESHSKIPDETDLTQSLQLTRSFSPDTFTQLRW